MDKITLVSAASKKAVFNHANKTIIVSDKFLRASQNPENSEFYDMMTLSKHFSDYTITTRTHSKPRKSEKTPNIPKFVSYDHMKKYINLLSDSEKLLEEFELVKDYARAHNYAASIVFNWFNETFPDYRFAPKIDKDGNLIATVNVVNFADYKKSVEEKARAKTLAKAQAELPETADPQEDELDEVI